MSTENECVLRDEEVSTRLETHPAIEIDGSLFNRTCPELDTTIPRYKDRFITQCTIPEVPKGLITLPDTFQPVDFPAIPTAEIPKKLLASMLTCCLEGRTAGFDLNIEEDLDTSGQKRDLTVAEALLPLTIQLGTESYLSIGLNLYSESCFCDETCGDEDFINIKVNATAEYTKGESDNPDLEISDEDLKVFIKRYTTKIDLYCGAKMPNTDLRPEGAYELPAGKLVYCDQLDSFWKEKEVNANTPYVYNPCGYPSDRPVILGEVKGFPTGLNIDDDYEFDPDRPPITHPGGDYVALACDTRDFFYINHGSTVREIPEEVGVHTFYPKGSLHYITRYDNAWIPSNSYQTRLAVCQRDFPKDWEKEYRMPFYTPEMNYGIPPLKDNSFVERCGVYPGEIRFSNKRLDYCYKNGRYSYEPIFTYTATAKTVSSGLGITIEGNDYSVRLPHTYSTYSAPEFPDIYSGDEITVRVDASGSSPVITAIEFQKDFPTGTVLLSYNGVLGYSRGWIDITEEVLEGALANADWVVIAKNNYNWQGLTLANFTNHQCNCSGSQSANVCGVSDSCGGYGGCSGCEHVEIIPPKVSTIPMRWFKKVRNASDGCITT